MVKGNQARTLWAIQKLFVHEACNLKNGAPLSKDIRTAKSVNKGHGRKEDATRLTLGNAGHIMAILNNALIGLCLQNGYQNLAQARRLFNAKPDLAFDLLRFDKSHS